MTFHLPLLEDLKEQFYDLKTCYLMKCHLIIVDEMSCNLNEMSIDNGGLNVI